MVLLPFAFIVMRRGAPPLLFMRLFKMFMHALIGITLSLNVYNVALNYTSATVASATNNSIPVITFFLAVLLRVNDALAEKGFEDLVEMIEPELAEAHEPPNRRIGMEVEEKQAPGGHHSKRASSVERKSKKKGLMEPSIEEKEILEIGFP
ncbi:hypothetical protein J5N97_025781 [Dioscorea zingiberensis]|uniref:PIN-like protein n=1 Tax=Dioscorea zingiberensis TaxID=325984 RepID=A0A9D5C1V9_9LILI|nr:hypothetical protein J5N97_025781 [Dioscorea zingiberensis]